MSKKKIKKLREWLAEKHKNANDREDYTRERAFMEVLIKIEELEK